MDQQQHEIYEYARQRIKQKKSLYFHFILIFVGSLFLLVGNKWMGIAPHLPWSVWVITFWAFFFILHFIKVFITDSFMNKKWERAQIDKLMLKQNKKIEQLQNELDNSPSNTL